jgi:hypothetical protein
MTDTELRLIAALAIIGLSNKCNQGTEMAFTSAWAYLAQRNAFVGSGLLARPGASSLTRRRETSALGAYFPASPDPASGRTTGPGPKQTPLWSRGAGAYPLGRPLHVRLTSLPSHAQPGKMAVHMGPPGS